MIMRDLIERLEALEAKATKGPWEAYYSSIIVAGSDGRVGHPPIDGTVASLNDGEYIENGNAVADGALIVELRNNLPTIISALKAQEASNDRR